MVEIVGTWRLRSAYFAAAGTGERLDVLGAEPFGYAVFEPGGRLTVLITSSARRPAASDTEMAALYKSMVAYTGRWSVDGDTLITQVDGSWDPSWVGTEQVRHLAYDGRTLSAHTEPVEHPSFPGQQVIGYLDWEKEA